MWTTLAAVVVGLPPTPGLTATWPSAAAVDPSLPPPPPGAPPLHALTAPYDPDAAHFAALRAAMRDAVALVADHEPDGGGGFSVYAAGAAG